MNIYAQSLKHKLLSLIDEMEHKYLDAFVREPGKDFTRNRKFPFSSVIRFVLSMGSSALGQEILEYFQYEPGFPSASAFIQQRQKIMPEAFSWLFHEFLQASRDAPRLFEGFQLIAVDGTDIVYPLNAAEPNAFPSMKCSMLHLNAFFDVMNKQYIDAAVGEDETAAACTMADRLPEFRPVIVVADRGYESYNFFAHIEERLFDYVVRLRNSGHNCIAAGMGLPAAEEFDVTKDVVITRNSTGPFAVNPRKYKYISGRARFDFIPDSRLPDYEMTIRFVRFRLDSGELELLATSLPADRFPAGRLKELYHLRWGIETSFRELKHVLGLAAFHTKKADCIVQEIYARLIMYNFSMLVAGRIPVPGKERRHGCLVNFSQTIRICMAFFRLRNNSPPFDLETILPRFLLPERKGRAYTRTVYPQGAKAFNYRLT